MTIGTRTTPQTEPAGVHPLELFFDLVFVFAVSQIAHIVIEPHAWTDYLQTGLLLVTVLWVYSTFVMLAANLGLKDGEIQRWLLLGGMAVFFGISMGIPSLAHGHPVTFAIFLAAATAVHLTAFSPRFNEGASARGAAPIRVALGLTIVVATLLPTPARWIVWGVAAIVLLALVGRLGVFRVHAAHLCERIGLAVIIALGEGIIQAGTAVQEHLDVAHVASAFAVLLLLAIMWWIYFGLNAEAFEHALTSGPAQRRAEVFAMAHLPVLGGIILVSAAAPALLESPTHAAPHAAAWNLVAGVSLYLLGIAGLRATTGLRVQIGLIAAAAAALVVAPVAMTTNAAIGLTAAIACGLAVGFGYTPEGSHRMGHSAPGEARHDDAGARKIAP